MTTLNSMHKARNSVRRNRARLIFASIMLSTLVVALLTGCTPFEKILTEATGQGSSDQATTETLRQEGKPQTTVLRIIDGDTIAVEPTEALPANDKYGREHVVRLLGIDAPEIAKKDGSAPAECGGDEASDYLRSVMPEGTNVQLVFDMNSDHTDRYERSLAYVEMVFAPDANPIDVNYALARGGFVEAWHPAGTVVPERFYVYEKAQGQAEHDNAGSWATCNELGR